MTFDIDLAFSKSRGLLFQKVWILVRVRFINPNPDPSPPEITPYLDIFTQWVAHPFNSLTKGYILFKKKTINHRQILFFWVSMLQVIINLKRHKLVKISAFSKKQNLHSLNPFILILKHQQKKVLKFFKQDWEKFNLAKIFSNVTAWL